MQRHLRSVRAHKWSNVFHPWPFDLFKHCEYKSIPMYPYPFQEDGVWFEGDLGSMSRRSSNYLESYNLLYDSSGSGKYWNGRE